MLKRLIVGLILGSLIGAAVASVFVQGLGMALFPNAFIAYAAAAAVGVVTGLVAGKPIWAADGKIEAGLKAFFGILLGIGGMFALRWLNTSVDLTMLKAGEGTIGVLPAASLPIIAVVLSVFYEIDNTPAGASQDAGSSAKSNKLADKKVRIDADEESSEVDDVSERQAKKRSR